MLIPNRTWFFASGLAWLWFINVPGAAAEEYQRYWGDLHGHTVFSDGTGTVAEYFQYARDVAQLDFVGVTDHDFGHAAPWRMPKAHWQETQTAADRYTLAGRFVALAGYEWTSQPKYWRGFTNGASEGLFPGLPRFFNHKNVYFSKPVEYLFSAKETASMTPDQLARAVEHAGGLVHNNHPTAENDGRDQFDYESRWFSIIANTEMLPDTMRYNGKTYSLLGEQTVRAFLDRGGRTGFVGGSDTHEGQPAARTAVFATELTREAIFDALRHRRNYAVSNARIELEFTIDGRWMGEEITVSDQPRVSVSIQGTARLAEVVVIRNGAVWKRETPPGLRFEFRGQDHDFSGQAYYYVRVTQTDADAQGNPSRAWSSPIWVKAK